MDIAITVNLSPAEEAEVAAILGLKDSSPISRWEKGLSLPSLEHLFGLSRIYKTMPNEMYLF